MCGILAYFAEFLQTADILRAKKMKVLHTVEAIRAALEPHLTASASVGLVPTMGALHAGHRALVERCVSENSVSVVTVFVNPTQFNDKADLANYPRTLEADCEMLAACGVDYVFAPSETEMYPQTDTRVFSYPPLDEVMEGVFRPGHFNGVCQIVSKLFDLIRPTKAYFGEKDYQQLAIIRAMVEDKQYPLQIVGCPIVREADGLAMSSRNKRLSPQEREQALAISRTLFAAQGWAATHSLEQTREFVNQALAAAPGLRPEYFEIVDHRTLQPLAEWSSTTKAVGCVAVFCGPVRLIDNITFDHT